MNKVLWLRLILTSSSFQQVSAVENTQVHTKVVTDRLGPPVRVESAQTACAKGPKQRNETTGTAGNTETKPPKQNHRNHQGSSKKKLEQTNRNSLNDTTVIEFRANYLE